MDRVRASFRVVLSNAKCECNNSRRFEAPMMTPEVPSSNSLFARGDSRVLLSLGGSIVYVSSSFSLDADGEAFAFTAANIVMSM